jgi:hypothetical protein
MVEIGVSLLAPDPSNDPKRGGARGWALDVLEKYSGVKFSEEARKVIIGNPIQVDRQILPGASAPPQGPPITELQGLDELVILDDPNHSFKWTKPDGTPIDFTQPVAGVVIKAATKNTKVLGGHVLLGYRRSVEMGVDVLEYLKSVGSPIPSGTCFKLVDQFRVKEFQFGKIEDAACP